jgi:hypothetical protein
MSASPTSLTIRMYNVGFGDCFLLSFKYANRSRHVLVDYGSTSAPKSTPKHGPKKYPTSYMSVVAEDIKRVCAGKLDAVVATHRHRDHVSGFSSDTGTGQVIATLSPGCVIQPWTEDPRAKASALSATSSIYTRGRPDHRKMTAHFLGALEDMHRAAESIQQLADRSDLAGSQTLEQLKFLGQDNVKNPSAVRNLLHMGQKSRAYYVNAGMRLNFLPGVRCTVLGPPALRQSDAIRNQRTRDPGEFWQFRSFWASQSRGLTRSTAFAKRRSVSKATAHGIPPPSVRWFVNQARQVHADQMLGLVRDLDDVMNNTSVILLLEAGRRKILLPGDAQIENWAYALSKPKWRRLLSDVNVYKVGHHGSRNATPKSLWDLFHRTGVVGKADRLETLCSTKSGKHGSARSGTEVPRRTLVADLRSRSTFTSTEELKDEFCYITDLAL